MADVFLSYAREDEAVAGKLATLLESNGLSVWWDRRLVAGDNINKVIDHALDQASAVVVLWSPSSVASRWVSGEAETAAEANKLIPVRIADCKLPINFRGLHTPDVYKSKQQLAELAELLSGKLRPNAPPARQVKFNDASTGRFLNDLASVLIHQSPNFGDQMRRELDISLRYPLKFWGGGLAIYAVCVWAVYKIVGLSFNAATLSLTTVSLVLYFLYRAYRLSRTR